MLKRFLNKTDSYIMALDRFPLWWTGLLLLAVFFYPILKLGQGCVFPYHDQLDESLMLYVLHGRHMFEHLKVFPEMMGGLNAGGLEVSAPLFVPLYHFLSAHTAYLLQYAIVALTGFLGMYFCIKEITESSILAVSMAGCFFMLPLYPIYGLSLWGIPMALYAFIKLYKEERIALQLFLLAYFACTAHLVYTGYVVIGFCILALVWLIVQKKPVKWISVGLLDLFFCYGILNRNLIREFIFGTEGFVSHRGEMINGSMPFFDTVKEVFINSLPHTPSYHKYIIIPILILLITEGIFWKQYDEKERKKYCFGILFWFLLIGIAVFYAFCKSPLIVNLKNSTDGIFHSLQIDRFYWLYPALWYLEFGLIFSVWWNHKGTGDKAGLSAAWNSRIAKILVLVFLLFPTVHEIAYHSVYYMNINQKNNGSAITGYIPWESYYAEDLMQELEDAIGRDKETYRIGHLGISPAPAIYHGFYTIDGYSDNYDLAYKHKFRKVIAAELEKAPETATYFDTWGSRCYLFNAATGNAWMLGKNTNIVYENLEFDRKALKELGCDYLFSCGEIKNAEKLGFRPMGYYETESSYWGVWLYEVM